LLPGGALPTERPTGAALPSPFKFHKYGQSGIEVSDIFRRTAESIDDIAVIRSMHADIPSHEASLLLMNCGDARQIRPSLGSWLCYGLGSENQNLPAFVSMCPFGYPIQETQNWQSGFLPGVYEGAYVDTQHTAIEQLIEHVRNDRLSLPQQREQLDLLERMNNRHLQTRQNDSALESRIRSFELGFRMQTEAAEAFDVHVTRDGTADYWAEQIATLVRPIFDPQKPTALFVGRYQPFHDGHKALIAEGLRRVGQVCIAVRDTPTDDKNPFGFEYVRARIEHALREFEGRFLVMQLPNVTHIFYGRDVGYQVQRIELDEAVEAVSATDARARLQKITETPA